MLNPHRRGAARLRIRRNERGDILLVTMVFLLLCLLGLIGSMRDTIVSTTLAGNNLMRQKDTQIADVAQQAIRNQILAANVGGTPLADSAAITSQAWWRDVSPTTAATPPTAAYWAACLGNSDVTKRCGSVALTIGSTTLPYTALAVVQPTGRSDQHNSVCSIGSGSTSLMQAVYYAVFIHVQETNGATNVNTESVYTACEQYIS
jgi:Tfp pilus assembly protein PilX